MVTTWPTRFDRIFVQQGLALLDMFETWAGEEPFRKGSAGTSTRTRSATRPRATSSPRSARRRARISRPRFATFLDQPGIPLLTMDLVCGKGVPPRLTIAQSRYAPAGSKAQPETWQIPVCVRFGEGKTSGRQCTVVRGAKAELALESARCPAWIAPNAEAAGYFHVAASPALRAKIAKAPLVTRERLQLAYDLYALAKSGQLPAVDALVYATRSSTTTTATSSRRPRTSWWGWRAWSPTRGSRPTASTCWRRSARARGRSLFAKRGETRSRWRSAPRWSARGKLGHDPMLTLAARKHSSLVNDPKRSTPRWTPLSHAAVRDGDAALFDRWWPRPRRTRSVERHGPRHTRAFKDPARRSRARDGDLGDFELREASRVISDQFADPTQREAAWTWYRANLDKIAAKVPRGGGAYMAMVGAAFCEARHREEYVATFEARSKKAMGGPRIYAQVLERIDQCIAMREAHGAALGKLWESGRERGGITDENVGDQSQMPRRWRRGRACPAWGRAGRWLIHLACRGRVLDERLQTPTPSRRPSEAERATARSVAQRTATYEHAEVKHCADDAPHAPQRRDGAISLVRRECRSAPLRSASSQ